MVSDFFYPNIGGVEEHIFNLSQCLMSNGNKVVVVTHSYGNRKGVRYMSNGLKVYYIPIKVMYNQCVLPTYFCNIPIIRYIYIRERVDIVHSHSAFSTLAHEGLLVGNMMGLKTVFTDHSLLGFSDVGSIFINIVLRMALSACNHCICVSHTGKENTVLRANAKIDNVSVIPNSVDTQMFHPIPELRFKDNVTIIVLSRLVYRKGIDLVIQIIEEMCPKYPEINFLIGGDGPKRVLLEELRQRGGFHNRVTLLGTVEHSEVKYVMNKGHIFLNCSLTEAYCMAIVEAVSCGLLVVSTNVGGIPEVLPKDLLYLTKPEVPELIKGIESALHVVKSGQIVCPYKLNLKVKGMYDWGNIASRVERVYDLISCQKKRTLKQIFQCYLSSGVWPFLVIVALAHLMLIILDIFVPRENIDICRNYPSQTRKQFKKD